MKALPTRPDPWKGCGNFQHGDCPTTRKHTGLQTDGVNAFRVVDAQIILAVRIPLHSWMKQVSPGMRISKPVVLFLECSAQRKVWKSRRDESRKVFSDFLADQSTFSPLTAAETKTESWLSAQYILTNLIHVRGSQPCGRYPNNNKDNFFFMACTKPMLTCRRISA